MSKRVYLLTSSDIQGIGTFGTLTDPNGLYMGRTVEKEWDNNKIR